MEPRLRFGGGRVVRWSWVNFQCRASYNLDDSRARVCCACSRCGWGVVRTFLISSVLSLIFLPLLGDGPIETEILSQRAAKAKTTTSTVYDLNYGLFLRHGLEP